MEEIVFPNQIRMIRRTRGCTMKDIAAVLGVSLSAISKIEKGYRRIDEVQLNKISSFLKCPKESIFVYEKTSQQEVLKAWEREQERRKQINEQSGLKTLGAGFRYLRGEKMLTLHDVAKGAGMTLSVYHRIEMGQREVTEEQFSRIAHALGYTPENLQLKIYELDKVGSLQEFKKSGLSGIFHPKGGYNDLLLQSVSFENNNEIDLYEPEKGDFVKSSVDFPVLSDCFAVCTDGMLNGQKVKVVASKNDTVSEKDYAIYKENNSYILGIVCNKQENSCVLKISENKQVSVPVSELKKVKAVLM